MKLLLIETAKFKIMLIFRMAELGEVEMSWEKYSFKLLKFH